MVVAGLKITMTVTAMRREVQLVACKVDQELLLGEEEVLPADQELLVATAEVIKGNRLSIKNQEEAHANPKLIGTKSPVLIIPVAVRVEVRAVGVSQPAQVAAVAAVKRPVGKAVCMVLFHLLSHLRV